MAEELLVRFKPDNPDQVEWLLASATELTGTNVAHGTIEELATAAADKLVTLLLPAPQVLLTQTDLPAGSARNLDNALAFALEDQVASDVGELYFARAMRMPDGRTPVAATSREYLDTVFSQLQAAGISFRQIVSSALALPWQEGVWSVLIEQESLTLRYGEYLGLGIELDNARLVISRLLAKQPIDSPGKVRIWSVQTEAANNIRELLESHGCQVEIEASPANGLAVMTGKPGLNLLRSLQGNQPGIQTFIRQLWPAAALLMLAFVIHIGANAYQLWGFQQKQEQLQADIQTQFKQAFPDIKRVVDPMVQAQQQLQQRRRDHGRGSDAMLNLMYRVGEAINKNKPLEIARMDFRQGVMQITLLGDTVTRIESFKQQLQKDGSLQAEILSAVSRDNEVETRIRIKEVSA